MSATRSWSNENRILKALSNTVEKKKDAGEQEKANGKKALSVYNALVDNDQRNQFLQEYDTMGGLKGDMKWMTNFQKTVSGEKETSVQITENFLTRIVAGIIIWTMTSFK